MAEDKIRRLATEQKKRLIAGLLNSCESTPWYKRLSEQERQAYRRDVFERVGIYHDFMLDVIKVADDGSVVNEHALELLEQLHAGQSRLERALTPVAPGG
jgi:hypothetical protein